MASKEDISKIPLSPSTRDGNTDEGETSFENSNLIGRSKRNRKERTFDDFYVFGKGASTPSTPMIGDKGDNVKFHRSQSVVSNKRGTSVHNSFEESSANSNVSNIRHEETADNAFVKESSNINSTILDNGDRNNVILSVLEKSTSAPTKKKRGRPPKVKHQTTDRLSSVNLHNSIEAQSTPTRRKRSYEGMSTDDCVPRDASNYETSPLTGIINSSDKDFGSVSHNEVTPVSSKGESQDNSSTLTGSAVKRGRGRPRKEVTKVKNIHTCANDTVATDGENQGDNDSVEKMDQDLDGTPHHKSPVFGDKRSPSTADLTFTPDVDKVYTGSSSREKDGAFNVKATNNSCGSTIKRGRGRPRKHIITPKDSANDEGITQVEDSSLHTREDLNQDSLQSERGQERNSFVVASSTPLGFTIKRRIGRPRKDSSLTKSAQVSNVDFSESITKTGDNTSLEDGILGVGCRTKKRKVYFNSSSSSDSSGSDCNDSQGDREFKGINISSSRGRGRGKGGRGRGRSEKTSSESDCNDTSGNREGKDGNMSSSRGRGRGKRGRGRGRGRSQETECPTTNSSKPVTCVHCDLVLNSLPTYKYHLMSKHSLLYTRQKPNGIDDSSTVVKMVGYIICQKCSRRFHNAQYYRHHVIWCGRESETFFCEICKRSSAAQWEKQHVRNCRRQEEVKALSEMKKQEAIEKKAQEVIEEEEERKSGQKIKRKAARSALSMLHNVDSDGEEETVQSSGDNASLGGMEGEDDSSDDDDAGEDEDKSEDLTDLEDDAGGQSKNTEIVGHKKKKKNRGKRRTENNAFWIDICTSNSVQVSDSEKIQRLHDFYYGSNQCVLFPDLLPVVEQWKALSLSDREKYLPSSKQSPLVSCTKSKSQQHVEDFSLKMGEAKFAEGKGFGYTGGPIWAIEWCPLPTLLPQEQILAVASDAQAGPRLPVNAVEEGSNLLQFWSMGNLDDGSNDVSLRLAFCIAHDSGYVRSLTWCPKGCFDKGDVQHGNNSEESKQPDSFLSRQGLIAVACSDSSVLIFSIPQTSSVESLFKQPTSGHEKPIVVKPKPCRRLVPNSQSGATPCLSVSWQHSDKCQWIIGGYGRGEILMWAVNSSPALICEDDKTLRPIRAFLRHKSSVVDCAWCPSMPDLFVSCDFSGFINAWDANRPHEPECVLKKKSAIISKAVCWAGPICWGFFSANDRFNIPETHSRLSDRYPVKFHSISPLCWPSLDFCTHVIVHPMCTWGVTYDPLFNVLVTCDTVGNVLVSLLSESKLMVGPPSKKSFLLPYRTPQSLLYKASVTGGSTNRTGDNISPAAEQLENTSSKLSSSHIANGTPAAGSKTEIKESERDSEKCSDEEKISDDFVLQYQDCEMEHSELRKPTISELKFQGKMQIRERETFGGSNVEAVHSVRLCPSMGCSLWLASGGNSGLLRIDSLSDLVLPHRQNIERRLLKLKKELESSNS